MTDQLADEDFLQVTGPYRRELLAHCLHLRPYGFDCFAELLLSRIQLPCPKPDLPGFMDIDPGSVLHAFLAQIVWHVGLQLSPSGDHGWSASP